MSAAAVAKSLDEQLMDAVSAVNLNGVRSALERGANPNFCRLRDEDEPDGYIQPTTPLRLVMFRISDCCLSDEELVRFAEIARVLLAAGADPLPAMVIAEWRYGDYDPTAEATLFEQVWTVVAQAAAAAQAAPQSTAQPQSASQHASEPK
jgi:hypothetical protein